MVGFKNMTTLIRIFKEVPQEDRTIYDRRTPEETKEYKAEFDRAQAIVDCDFLTFSGFMDELTECGLTLANLAVIIGAASRRTPESPLVRDLLVSGKYSSFTYRLITEAHEVQAYSASNNLTE